MKVLEIYKIGGNCIDNEQVLDNFLNDFTEKEQPKILVHGGGVMAGQMASSLNIPVRMIDGRRVTDRETLKIVTMVYAGWANKNIVAQLEKKGCRAMGLSGADGSTMVSVQRNPQPVDFGFVGDLSPEGINTDLINDLLRLHITPVFCAITCTREGQLLNTNADTVAGVLASAMRKYYHVRLIFVFDKEGVLYPETGEVIPLLSKKQYLVLKEQKIVTSGMLPKLDNAFAALEKGIEEVYVGKTKLQL